MNSQILKKITVIIATLVVSCMVSCQKENSEKKKDPVKKTKLKMVVAHYGNQTSKGEISACDDSVFSFFNDRYSAANKNAAVGSNIVSIALVNTTVDPKIYVLCNNPDKIVVLDPKTLQKIGEITDPSFINLQSIYSSNDLAYVTCKGIASDSSTSCVLKIDADNNTLKKKIIVPGGATRMERIGVKLFVTLSYKKSLSVIHMHLDSITERVSLPSYAGDVISNSSQQLLVSIISTQKQDEGYVIYNPVTFKLGSLHKLEIQSQGLFAANKERSRIWLCSNQLVYDIDGLLPTIELNKISSIDYDDYGKHLVVLHESSRYATSNGQISIFKDGLRVYNRTIGISPIKTMFFKYSVTE